MPRKTLHRRHPRGRAAGDCTGTVASRGNIAAAQTFFAQDRDRRGTSPRVVISSMADGLNEVQSLNLAKNRPEIIWPHKLALSTVPPRGSVHRSQRADRFKVIGLRLSIVSRGPSRRRVSDNLRPIASELAHRDQVEMAALLPSIAVVFTIAGPVVTKRERHQLA